MMRESRQGGGLRCEMRNYKAVIQYEGTRYRGWQVQGNTENTIQGKLEALLSRMEGAPVEVHAETAALIRAGIEYGTLSEGAFDITIGALSDLWDIPNNQSTVPAQADIARALATVGYEQIEISGNTVTLENPDAMLDLGGIAKGYAADQMKAYLNENGVHEGFINLGGNVLTLGEKNDRKSVV